MFVSLYKMSHCSNESTEVLLLVCALYCILHIYIEAVVLPAGGGAGVVGVGELVDVVSEVVDVSVEEGSSVGSGVGIAATSKVYRCRE